MNGDAFGINSRHHTAHAHEAEPVEAPLSWAYGPNGDDWTSTATITDLSRTTGMTPQQVRDNLASLERRGLLKRIAS